MPRGHKTHSEARRELLEASKEWKLEMAKPKTVATLAAATVGALDSVVAAQNFLLDREEALEVHVSKNTEGVGIAQKMGEQALRDIEDLHKKAKETGEKAANVDKQQKETAKLAARNRTEHQRNELDKVKNVLICKGIPKVIREGRKETFFERREAMHKVLQWLKITEPVVILNAERLQKSKDDTSKDPRPLRVTLGGAADKYLIFDAIDRAIRNGTKFNFSIAHEVPRYALSRYKFLQRVAATARKQDQQLKTRVGMVPGELFPIIQTKNRREPKYTKIKEGVFNAAKSAYLAEAKERKPSGEQQEQTIWITMRRHS